VTLTAASSSRVRTQAHLDVGARGACRGPIDPLHTSTSTASPCSSISSRRACASPFHPDQLYSEVTSAWTYRNLTRADFDRWLDRAVPENAPYFVHTAEGPDDMPAHVKSGVMGVSVSVPVRDGRLALGTWQGIYLGEHRDQGGSRSVVVTLFGE